MIATNQKLPPIKVQLLMLFPDDLYPDEGLYMIDEIIDFKDGFAYFKTFADWHPLPDYWIRLK